AANVGPNPTFGEGARKVEVHLIGYQGDLYGRPLAVDFLKRLRDTRPFSGPAELVGQLRRAGEQARKEGGWLRIGKRAGRGCWPRRWLRPWRWTAMRSRCSTSVRASCRCG